MTAAALLGVAGSGRSAPSAAHPQPYRYRGGMSAKPAADLPPNVCNFRLSEVRNFRLSLTRNAVRGGLEGPRLALASGLDSLYSADSETLVWCTEPPISIPP